MATASPLDLAQRLALRGGPALAGLPLEVRLRAWEATVALFRDSGSPVRQGLDATLARHCRLSPQGLSAGLETLLAGLTGPPLERLAAPAANLPPVAAGLPPALVILAGNLPALGLQVLLPALVAGRPLLLKCSSAEPLFLPAFLAELAEQAPGLGEAFAATTWPGGQAAIEAPLLAAADPVVVYGSAETVASVSRRARGRVVAFGPRTSLAVVARDADPSTVAAGLARDVALFDQRGCLSVAAVYVEGDAEPLATFLAEALAAEARRLPPGPPGLAEAAGARLARQAAELAGLSRSQGPLAEGTVILDPDPRFHPAPGLRTVRVHPLADLGELPTILAPWQDRLQGAALAGASAEAQAPALAALGVSRIAAPGTLQATAADWKNAGVDLVGVFASPTS
ncbi:MAG TPA: aldehyde dehydrogenase family protein [Thermoanaerobaculia bacterium]|nr:aldehyde dehydrogenase family protein [Thermoanaerobaculia bacterium]